MSDDLETNAAVHASSVRKTARMSTGGRPPKKNVFIDSEADVQATPAVVDDDDSDDDGGEDQDKYGGSFIDDDEPIEWERTPTPVQPDHESEDEVMEVDRDERGNDIIGVLTDPISDFSKPVGILTRSQAKAGSSGASGSSKHILNTKSYMGADSDRNAGQKSKSLALGFDASDRQTQLEVVKPVDRTVKMSDALYQKYMEWVNEENPTPSTPVKGAQTKRGKKAVARVPKNANEKTAATSIAKAVGTVSTSVGQGSSEVTLKRKRRDDELAVSQKPGSTKGTTPPDPPTRKNLAATSGAGGKLPSAPTAAFKEAVTAGTDSSSGRDAGIGNKRLKMPVPPVEAFKSKKAEASQAPAVTTKPVKVNKILETTNVRKPRDSPLECEVMDANLQDEWLKAVYDMDLPKLKKSTFISWSSSVGPGMFMLSDLARTNPNVDIASVWSFVNFDMKGRHVNLARVNPSKLEAVFQLYGNNERRWTLSIKGQPAICLSVVNTTKSSLTQISSVTGAEGPKVPLLKYLTAIHLSQEFDRMVGVCGMVFDLDEMHAQLSMDALTFGTRGTTAKRIDAGDNVARMGVPSSSSKYSSSSYNVGSEALHYESDVPVYDGRGVSLVAEDCVDKLDQVLKPYVENGGEIQNNSCTVVAYTVTQWLKTVERKTQSGSMEKVKTEQIGFNIQWAIVLGEKE
ncbi:hypothetical protein K438DRAFT_1757224 [Mycena galopus ATCC 62051]|nr:hypothetical protein K438DRAFT_1757224 [Mycena galopus ATCC 62051]